MADLLTFEVLLSLFTLTALEIVLGVDNLVFISIITRRLPENQQPGARRVGLIAAMAMRIILLFAIAWVIRLTEPLFTLFDFTASWRDIILFGGGLFLLLKGTLEIHSTVEGEHNSSQAKAGKAPYFMVILQIMVLDLIFSLDSVITAVGMVEQIEVMVTAIIIAVLVMMWAAEPLSAFISRHPTVKMLALAFLLLVGTVLIADGLHFHVPRGYIYFAIAFSILVEGLNLAAARNRKKKRQKS